MKRWFAVTAALALLASAVAFAADESTPQPGGPKDRPRFKGLMPPRALKELNLTKEQEAKYKELDQAFLKERQQWMEEHKPKGEQPPPPPEGDDNDGPGRRPKLPPEARQQIHELRKKYMDQFRATLTAEQIKQLDEQIGDVKERRESRRKQRDEDSDDK